MKKPDTKILMMGLSVFTVLLCSAASVNAQGTNDTVSAVGTTPAPVTTTNTPPQPNAVAPMEEAAPATTTPPAVATTTAPVVTNAPAAPANSGLTPLPESSDANLQGTNVMGDSGAREKHSGTYYDSNALVPDSDLKKAGATGVRKVDPAYEPGQKYIVVEQSAKAGSYESQYVAATRALSLGRYAAAMEMFEKLYKKNHKDPRILMGLAVAQQGAGFNESAATTYEDLLKVEPNNADAIVNLMGIMKTQYPSVTLKKLQELRAKYPMNPGIPAQMGLLNGEQKNYEDAMRYLEIAASMQPNNPSHVYNMAIVADKMGDASKAVKLYEQALSMDASYGSEVNNLPREQIYDRLVILRRKV